MNSKYKSRDFLFLLLDGVLFYHPTAENNLRVLLDLKFLLEEGVVAVAKRAFAQLLLL